MFFRAKVTSPKFKKKKKKRREKKDWVLIGVQAWNPLWSIKDESAVGMTEFEVQKNKTKVIYQTINDTSYSYVI